VDITTADTAVADLHLDVGLLEGLGSEATPFHVSLGRRRVVGDPALEVGVAGSHGVSGLSIDMGLSDRIVTRDGIDLFLRLIEA
jgi:hypothetical protein